MKNILKFTALLTLPLMLTLPAQAMTATQRVEVEQEVQQADGSFLTVMKTPEQVLPGDLMVYTVSYFNDKQDVTDNFQLDMPIPAEITYIEGSADLSGARVVYSVDNGQTFTSRNALSVVSSTGETRAASANDITHIRWTLSQSIQPGNGGEIRFKGRLK